VNGVQPGKTIVDPLNPGGGMTITCGFAERIGRFDGDHLVVLVSKPGGVAARTGSHVENQKLRGREKGEPIGVNLGGVHAFVAPQKVLGAAIVD
jgi:hypothetical protein